MSNIGIWRTACGISLTIALASLTPPARAANASDDTIARGKYLATAGDCVACHTGKSGQELAGGRDIDTPFGPMASPNITPDRDTGIGSWSDDQFYRAMHEGVGAHGEYLYPVFPYPWFTKITRDDVMAIKAYLFSLPPVHSPRHPNHLMFPFDIRLGVGAWNALFFTPGTFKPDPDKSPEYNRGAYLVEGLGHCGDCHTPKNIAEAPIHAQAFAGAPIQKWFAPNITGDVSEGIGGWSDDQLLAYFKTGVAPGKSVVAGPMAETVHDSLAHMTDEDLRAIGTYLKEIPTMHPYQATQVAALATPHSQGVSVYLTYCASCHQVDGKGVPGAVPALAGNGAVNAQGPEDVIRVVLGGMPAAAHYAPMPAVGAAMTDQEISNVTNYIRTAWSNTAPANVGPGTVGEIRKDTHTLLAGTPEGGCPDLGNSPLKAILDKPGNDITPLLQRTNDDNLLTNVAKIVDELKSVTPGLAQADLVNDLTTAYCPIAAGKDGLRNPANRERLDNFSELVYAKLAGGTY